MRVPLQQILTTVVSLERAGDRGERGSYEAAQRVARCARDLASEHGLPYDQMLAEARAA